jgi:hypothetical protein
MRNAITLDEVLTAAKAMKYNEVDLINIALLHQLTFDINVFREDVVGALPDTTPAELVEEILPSMPVSSFNPLPNVSDIQTGILLGLLHKDNKPKDVKAILNAMDDINPPLDLLDIFYMDRPEYYTDLPKALLDVVSYDNLLVEPHFQNVFNVEEPTSPVSIVPKEALIEFFENKYKQAVTADSTFPITINLEEIN